MLHANSLAMSYNDNPLFAGVTLVAAPGAIVQLGGRNGCGKSTLLRLLAGLSVPDAGTVHWCGRRVGPGGAHCQQELGYLGHRNGIKAELTATENLDLARAINGGGPSTADLLRRVGLAHCENRSVGTFSAGQQRRLALAHLLLREVPLWLLDEPLNALDSDGVDLITSLMSCHAAAGGVVVVATHQPLPLREEPVLINLDAREYRLDDTTDSGEEVSWRH